ncbi:MAG: transglycosylase domain-containing protein [Lachnospiraceae bacterium]
MRRLTFATSNRDLVTLDEIPKALQQAVIAIEDERFTRITASTSTASCVPFSKVLRTAPFPRVPSTITQQLIKNQVFTEWTTERTFLDRMRRKVQEQYLAIQLEKRSSKEEILENYLNTINLGSGCYGVQSAAKRYFGKGCLRPHPLRMRRTRRDPAKSIRLQSCFFSGSEPPSPAHCPQLYGSTGLHLP